AGQVEIHNRRDFTSLADLTGRWSLEIDGEAVAAGRLPPLDIAPGEAEVVTVSLPRLGLATGREAFLMLRFTLTEAAAYASAGHEVAWVQLPVALPKAAAPPQAPTRAAPLAMDKPGGRVRVTGEGFELSFSAEHGLGRMVWRGHPVIAAGPRLQIWRGPTDNDGIKGMPKRRGNTLGEWLAAGFDQLSIGPARIEAMETNAGVQVRLDQVAACAASATAIAFRHTYRISPDGRVAVDCAFSVDSALNDLPRLGVTLTLPDEFEALEWFGRGPLETYSDRKRAAWVGRFASTVSDQ